MKFSYSLLTLMAITSSVLAANIVNEVNESTIAEEKGEVYFKCYKAFKLIEKDCIPIEKDSYSKSKLDTTCDNFNTEKCQKLMNEPLSVLPDCSELNDDGFNDFGKFINQTMTSTKLYCTKNENNEYCPITDISIYQSISFEEYLSKVSMTVSDLSNDDEFKKTIDETCKSKKCRDAALEAFNQEDVDSYVTFIETRDFNETDFIDSQLGFYDIAEAAVKILRDDKCIATTYNMGNASGANSLTIGLRLVFFYFSFIFIYIFF